MTLFIDNYYLEPLILVEFLIFKLELGTYIFLSISKENKLTDWIIMYLPMTYTFVQYKLIK